MLTESDSKHASLQNVIADTFLRHNFLVIGIFEFIRLIISERVKNLHTEKGWGGGGGGD